MGKVHFEQKYIQGRKRAFCIEALLCFPVTSHSRVHTLQAVAHRGQESSEGQNLPAERTIQSPGPYGGTTKESAF